MITKELINSTLTADNSSETSLNLGKMSAMVNWDINGGDGDSTRNIYLYGRIKSNNNVVARGHTGGGTISSNLISDPNKMGDFTSAWQAINGLTGSIDTDTDPNSTTTADTIIALAANGQNQHLYQFASTITSTPNQKVTFSFYLKKRPTETGKTVLLLAYLFANGTADIREAVSIRVTQDTLQPVSINNVLTNGPIDYTLNDLEISDEGNDWFKVSFPLTDFVGDAHTPLFRLYPHPQDGVADTDAVVWGGSIVTGDSTAVFDPSEWVLIDSVENKAQETSGYFNLDNIYPQVAVRTSGNAGESTIRVWATYNELVN